MNKFLETWFNIGSLSEDLQCLESEVAENLFESERTRKSQVVWELDRITLMGVSWREIMGTMAQEGRQVHEVFPLDG